VIDNEKGDLWTKVNSGKLEIRIPMEEGIEGYVASKEESVNVMDAYQDDRFSKQVDIQTNYKTNTLLCVPIMDQNKKAVGVLQAINKNQGIFGKDDEGLLNIIAGLADIVLKNTLTSE